MVLSLSLMCGSPSSGILVSAAISSSSDDGSPTLGFASFHAVSNKIYTLSTLTSPLYRGTPASPGVSLGREEVLGLRAGFSALGGNEIAGSDVWGVRDGG